MGSILSPFESKNCRLLLVFLKRNGPDPTIKMGLFFNHVEDKQLKLFRYIDKLLSFLGLKAINTSNTNPKRNFATNSLRSVEIKSKHYTSKILEYIWTLIGYMNDTFKKNYANSQSEADKVELRHVSVRVPRT